MANLSKSFKKRQTLCKWLEENKPILQEESGFEFTDLQIANDLLIGGVKINSSSKVLIIPDFNFNDDSLNLLKSRLENSLDFRMASVHPAPSSSKSPPTSPPYSSDGQDDTEPSQQLL